MRALSTCSERKQLADVGGRPAWQLVIRGSVEEGDETFTCSGLLPMAP